MDDGFPLKSAEGLSNAMEGVLIDIFGWISVKYCIAAIRIGLMITCLPDMCACEWYPFSKEQRKTW
jgi:hypothetical protein